MFGRLSEKKREHAIKFMVETTEDISRTLIIWATGELKTPQKPFMDELYLLCAVLLSNNYLAWRKYRPDAHGDVTTFIDLIFTHAFEEYRRKFPFHSDKRDLDDFLFEIHERRDDHADLIDSALRAEVGNIAAELDKYRSRDSSSDDPHMQYMNALTAAEHPFRDAIVRTLFPVDQDHEIPLGGYDYFASQASSFLIRHDDIFREGLRRL